jgi:hypothetical protein
MHEFFFSKIYKIPRTCAVRELCVNFAAAKSTVNTTRNLKVRPYLGMYITTGTTAVLSNLRLDLVSRVCTHSCKN